MIQARIKMFETNSSSCCTLMIWAAQVVGLDVPTRVDITPHTDSHYEDTINSFYDSAEQYNELDTYLSLLRHAGVKDIFVNGKPAEFTEGNYHTKFEREEIILAKLFGNCPYFSESRGYGGDYGDSDFLTKSEIRDIQNYAKDTDFVIICHDEDGNELNWSDLKYSKMVITDEDIEKEKEYLQRRALEEDDELDYLDYSDALPQTPEEDDKFAEYDEYEKYYNKKRK